VLGRTAYDADPQPVTLTEPGGVTVASTYNNGEDRPVGVRGGRAHGDAVVRVRRGGEPDVSSLVERRGDVVAGAGPVGVAGGRAVYEYVPVPSPDISSRAS